MSRTVDSRIVEMRFDNKQFESGIKNTITSLGRLKEALKLPDSSKSLEGLSKASKEVKLDGIAAGIEALEKRFSTMGIVGMRVIENITDGLMNKIGSAVNFVTNAIVSGGMKRAMNIENAHFQLQSLLKDETKVQEVMSNANDSVTGTAYAYDEAAKAASQFAASGVEAGEDMMRALKGITGVAAMTNSEYEGISRIFTTVAGQGRVMGDQLLQLSSRGLNAASTIAKWFREVQGQANVTEAVVREMVTDGEISFQIFADAMGWAFGESAERANETFTGSFSNMKAALARIGQGFFTPFIEQNSEMVKLFNALRIKINDVKSALVFDEQTSAISGLTKESEILTETVSKFVKNGTTGLSEFTDAIIGAVKTEDELALSNDALSASYEKVQKAGYASAETFAEFNEQGINAGKAVRDYMNGVMDGSIKASKSVKDAVNEITQGTMVMVGDIGKYAREGKISYDIFTDAIVWGSGVIEQGTSMTTATIKNMMAEVKESGSVTMDTLVEFNKNNMNAAVALREYMNGVEDGSIRATYAVTQAVHEVTNGVKLGVGDITRLAEEGTITYDIFQAAMERTYGDQNKLLSRSFTESVLDQIKKITNAINQMDMTKPMEAFYYAVESVKNVFKGLYSVVKPVGTAFAEVFLSFDPDRIVDFAAAIERLTARMRLSEAGSKGLHDAMKGLFDVVKLVLDVFVKLISIVIPMGEPFADLTGGMTDGLLGLAGAVGRTVSQFTEFIRSSTLLQKAYQGLSTAVRLLAGVFVYAGSHIGNFLKEIYQLPEVQNAISKITSTFIELGNVAGRHISSLVTKMGEFAKAAAQMIPEKAAALFASFKEAIKSLANELSKLDLSTPRKMFEALSDVVEKFFGIFTKNGGVDSFIESAKRFGEGIREAFNFDSTVDRLNGAKDSFMGIVEWVQNTFGQMFGGFSVASTAAGVGGIGIIYAMIKAFKSFGAALNPLSSLSGILGSVKTTLTAYQHDLNASAMIKVAGAIAILAGALVVLSFVDTGKLIGAAFALNSLAATLMGGASALIMASKYGNTMDTALNTFAKGLSKTMKKLATALEIRAIGTAVKKFAESVAIIAVSIIALGLMYGKDAESMDKAVDLIEKIGLALGAMVVLMPILSSFTGKGSKNFSTAALGILSLSLSISLIVATLNKLFKMEFPPDWEFKTKVLVAMIGGLGILATVLGLANRIAGKGKISAGPILAITVMLIATVASLDKLFKMEFPPDWENRLIVLGLIFAELGAVMIALGVAAKLANGSIKATGTILAMCVFLATTVAALMILSIIPFEKLMSGATALGVVLMSLAVALVGAGKITNEHAHKTVLAMAIAVGSITAALGFLSMIPLPQLAKAAGVLAAMLMTMAVDFLAISKITNEEAWTAVLAMCGAVAVIAISLHFLAEEPWEGLLAGAVAMSAVLLSMGYVFKNIAELEDEVKIDTIGMFLLATTALIPIALALYTLSTQPWEGMLAAGAAISAVMLAYGLVFVAVAKTEPDLTAIALFLAGTLAIVPIAAALYVLAEKPWESLLAAGASITAVLLAMSAVMVVCATVGAAAPAALAGMALLDGFIVTFAALMVAMGAIFEIDGAQRLLNGGIAILIQLGEGIGEFVGAIVAGVITRISATLPQLGADLSAFMINLTPFIIGSKMIDAGSVASVGFLAAVIVALTAAEIINGIAAFFGLSFVDMAVELSAFMVALTPFIIQSRMLDESTAKACGYIATMVLALTAADLLSGITSFLGISGGISQFGEELEAFGPSISKFANDVKDVKPEAVEGAAAAAEIMANMANKLPGTGGLKQKIFGDKSLAEFGAELLAFGPSIAAFGVIVKDVKPEAVEGAAAAASIMAELNDKLPSQGGLKAKIFGDKKLSDFGAELVAFGPNIREFADTVKDVDPTAVTGAGTVTAIMSALANNLPESESLWSKIFGGGNKSLTVFGEELVKFGPSIKAFSDSVSGISTSSLESAVEAFKSLAELSDYVDEMKAQNIVDFSKKMKEVAGDGINTFVTEFNTGKTKVLTTIKSLFLAMSNTLTTETSNLSSKMRTNGSNIIAGLNEGLMSGNASLKRTSAQIAASIDQSVCKTLEIHSPSKVAEERGEQFDEGLEQGLLEGKDDIQNAAEEVGDAIDEGIEKSTVVSGRSAKKLDKSLSAIIHATEGTLEDLEDTMNSKVVTIGDAAAQMSLVIKGNLEEGLDIKYLGAGFAEAISEIGQVAANATQALIEGGENFQESLTMSRNASLVLKGLLIEDENAYWNELLAIKRAGADSEKYQTMELQDFQKEVLEEAKTIYENYVNEFESTKDRIISTYDLFTEVTKKETKNKDELVKILQSQIDAYSEYTEVITSLNTRLDGRALLEYLQNLSVDSLDQLKVMNEMTDEELTNYATLYDQKLSAATDIAVLQMQDLKAQTEQQMNDLFGTMYYNVNLDNFSQAFDGSIESIKNYLDNVVAPVEEFAKTIYNTTVTIGEQMAEGMATGVGGYANDMGFVVTETINRSLEGQGEVAKESAKGIGENIGEGILEGMQDTTGVTNAADTIMDSITESLKSAGEIHSPSELTKREIGVHLTEGITAGMTSNLSELGTACYTIIENIKVGLTDGKTDLIASTTGMMNDVIKAMFSSENEVEAGGSDMIDALIDGIRNKISLLMSTIKNLCIKMIDEFRKQLPNNIFRNIGENLMTSFNQGVKAQEEGTLETSRNMSAEIVKAYQTGLDKSIFVEIGENVSDGLKEGIENKIKEISDAAIEAARAAIESAKDELGVHSPSKVFEDIGEQVVSGFKQGITGRGQAGGKFDKPVKVMYKSLKETLGIHSPSESFEKIGENVALGMVVGLESRFGLIEDSSSDMANAWLDSTKSAIRDSLIILDNMSGDLSIKPVIDLTDVQNGARQIASLFDQTFDISPTYDRAMAAAGSFAMSRAYKEQAEQTDEKSSGNTYQFTQNNYSPKALTRTDIYRQTRNQFSAFREAVGNT